MTIRHSLLLLSFIPFSFMNAAHYFIDSKIGSDQADGTSPTSPWSSTSKINNYPFQPGDTISLRSGQTFDGHILPIASGSKEGRITLNRYGEGVKPHIRGLGKNKSALSLKDVSFWTIESLEITNTGKSRKARRTGVHLVSNKKVVQSIILRDLFIHDINGVFSKDDGGGSGIKWETISDRRENSNPRFEDLLIEDCHLIKCDRDGIKGGTNTPWDLSNLSTGVVIRGNLIEDVGGDGIVPIGTEGALVEYNRIYGGRTRIDFSTLESTRSAGASVGIWPWSANNTIFRFNEVWGYRGTYDGQGFDSDYNCDGSIFEYNFSADNSGGFFLICNDPKHLESKRSIGNLNTTIRNNISFNDHLRIFNIQGAPSEGLTVTGNIIYNDKETKLPVILVINKQEPKKANISGNYFYTTGKPIVGIGAWQKGGVGLYGYKQPLKNKDEYLNGNFYSEGSNHSEPGKQTIETVETLGTLIQKASKNQSTKQGFLKLLKFLQYSKHKEQIAAALGGKLVEVSQFSAYSE